MYIIMDNATLYYYLNPFSILKPVILTECKLDLFIQLTANAVAGRTPPPADTAPGCGSP